MGMGFSVACSVLLFVFLATSCGLWGLGPLILPHPSAVTPLSPSH